MGQSPPVSILQLAMDPRLVLVIVFLTIPVCSIRTNGYLGTLQST